MDITEYLSAEPEPLPGDPVLRTLVGLVNCGEVRGVEIVVNIAGQMISGFLIPASEFVAGTDDDFANYRMSDDVRFLWRQTLLLAAPEETDEDPYGFKHADHVHISRPDPMGRPGDPSAFWRGRIESVDSWSVSR